MAVRPVAEAAIGRPHTPTAPNGCVVGFFATSRRPWGLRGHPRGLRRVKLSQAGSIGGFNDQGGCGCAHPAVRLFPLVPWASGVPRVAHRGAVGIARDPPGLGKIYPFTHPSTRVYNGPWGGPEVTGVCTRLFGETPGVLQRLRGSSLE